MAAILNPYLRALGESLGIVISLAAFSNELLRKIGLGSTNLVSVTEATRQNQSSNAVTAFLESLRISEVESKRNAEIIESTVEIEV